MFTRIPYADLFGDQKPKIVAAMAGVGLVTARAWVVKGVPWYWRDDLGPSRIKEIICAMEFVPPIQTSWREYGMICDYRQGKTLEEIGQAHGLTRERVRQLLAKNGVTRNDGGGARKKNDRTLVLARSMQDKRAAKRVKIEAVFGCSFDEITKINGKEFNYSKTSRYSTPAGKYFSQMRAAKRRLIGWEITFPEWWRVWQESGHWEKRGPGQGYCMTRIGDTGPYHVDNVEIKTIGENFSESYYKHPWVKRFSGVFVKKVVCIRGHDRTGENVTKHGDCRECARIKHAEYRERRKANNSQREAA